MSRRKSSGRGPAKAPAPPLILVVDDYADNREMYSAYLKFQGLEVVEAATGLISALIVLLAESNPWSVKVTV